MKKILPVVVVFGAVALMLAAAPAAAEDFAYVGVKNCKKCHIKEWRSWSKTKMATAFDALKPGERAEAKTGAGLDPDKDYTQDAECVRCHVTGYGKPGGFVDEASSPELIGVGCESCHGPGGTYTADGYMTMDNKEYAKSELVAVGMVGEVGEAQCVGCHNSDSPFVDEGFVFDYAAKKDEGTHEMYELKYKH